MTAVGAEIVGWAGAAALLAGYALLSLGRIPHSRRYQVLNLAGSAGLAINGVVHQAWPSTVLNLVWVAIGAVALARLARLARLPRPEAGATGPQPKH
ncbi:CBU_0592 family membrane protein [Cryptosporangium minutisporangium]|uniref:CBU-0592-like domain-containing protein n=1 Tax=Cryptosporangium minutisporangium TaxID=113569 RepID=A0ABP6TBP0_9ACTN